MEEWKFLDLTSDLFQDRTAALNLTTERWQLKPFPDGLVASAGYWDPNNKTSRDYFQGQLDAGVTYPCRGDYNRPCQGIRSCQSVDDPCFVPIEGIGATTVGPAHSYIVGLAHSVISLLVIVITLAVVMGCSSSTPYEDDYSRHAQNVPIPLPTQSYPLHQPVQSFGFDPRWEAPQQYAIPVREPSQRAVEIDWVCSTPASEAEKTRHITRLTALLREMYALDLKAWSMEGVAQREADKEDLLQARTEAERRFREVAFIIGQWRDAARKRNQAWTVEETRAIETIYAMVSQHLPEGSQAE